MIKLRIFQPIKTEKNKFLIALNNESFRKGILIHPEKQKRFDKFVSSAIFDNLTFK